MMAPSPTAASRRARRGYPDADEMIDGGRQGEREEPTGWARAAGVAKRGWMVQAADKSRVCQANKRGEGSHGYDDAMAVLFAEDK